MATSSMKIKKYIFTIVLVLLIAVIIAFFTHKISIIEKKIIFTSVSDLNLLDKELNKHEIENLKYFTNLKKISLPSTIDDISFLNNMNKLEEITIYNTSDEKKDWSIISNCSNLKKISIYNGTPNIPQWKELNDLDSLKLMRCEIINLDGIKNLTNLEYLVLLCYSIDSIDELKTLTNLKYLKLSCKNVDDLSPLTYCNNLTELVIVDIGTPDYTSLTKCKNLKKITITENKISTSDVNYLISNNIEVSYFK